MTLVPGTSVGRYQILEPLGQGGMATVYKAFQPSLEREVALKVLRPGYAQDAEFRERFEREAKAIARLRHPHIVQVFDFEVSTSGEFVLAMEFLEGGTLKERVAALAATGRGMDPAESLRILGEVAEALSYAHEKGIVHRDVKPANVMLTHKDRAVVTDFGIARILGATSHTQTGVGIGTPEYMAPEQGQGGSVDHRADIYSLGAMAYELLVGRVPYTADTPLAVVIAHIKDPLPLPSKVNPTIGQGVERALLKALAKDPAQRFDSATAFAEALKDGLAEATRGGTIPTVVVRAGAAAPSVRTAAAPAAPKQLTLSLPPILSQRPLVLAIAGALVLAIAAGTVIASNALRPSAVTGPPAAAGAKIPARGALIWQAKLDGTDADARSVGSGPAGSDPTPNEFRFVPGAIEYVVHKATSTGSGRGFQFNSPARESFVFEVDIEAQAALSLRFNWWEASQQRYGMGIDVKNGRVQLEYSKPGGIMEPLTAAVPADDVRRANPFTAAVVVERTRFTAYVGGRQVVQAAPDGRVPPLAAPVGVIISGNEFGTVRLTGIRMYELPTSTGQSAAAPSLAPLTSAPKGKLVWEAKLDGATNDIAFQDVGPPPNAKPGDVDVRQVKGAIEVTIRTANIGAGIYPNATARGTYVFEMDAVAAPGSLTVYMRTSPTAGYPRIGARLGATTQITYQESASAAQEALTPPRAAEITNGSPFTATFVAEETRYSVFVGGKLVAQAVDARMKGDYVPRIFYSGPAGATFRMTGLRTYEIGNSTASAPPTVLAKGPLVWEAKLDGTDIDVRGAPSAFPGSDASDSDVRFVPGAIEFRVLKRSAGRNVFLNSPTRETFVLEIDVDIPAGGSFLAIGWWRTSDTGQYVLNLATGRLEFQYKSGVRLEINESLTPSTPANIRSGSPFTLALVVARDRFTAYADQRQVVQVAADGRLAPAAAQIRIFVGDAGTLRLTGIRMYALP